GYLIWRLYPETRVFIDGRTAYLYPLSFLEAAWQGEHELSRFEALEHEYEFDWAIVDAKPGLGRALADNPRWVMVYMDDVAAVYVPRRSAPPDQYLVLNHLRDWRQLARQPASTRELKHDIELALTQSPNSICPHLWAFAAAMKQDDRSRATLERNAVYKIAPE